MPPNTEELTTCAHCGKVIRPGDPRVTLTFCSLGDLDRFIENLKEET